jgi:hypothetical protein
MKDDGEGGHAEPGQGRSPHCRLAAVKGIERDEYARCGLLR